jgi:hypothetical protein
MTPTGVRIDRAIGADGETVNASWNTYWDAATAVTEDGWFAEMRIPLSSLRFQTTDGRAVLGLTTTRLIARKNERVTFPAIDPRFPVDKPSVAQDVILETTAHHQPAYVTPYVLSGVDRDNALNGAGTSFESNTRIVREIGGDLKYNLAENLTLDLSANTDFAQVEADDEQINLTRFSLFFPEKRQFFQERSGVFDFDMSAGGRVFHSRRIGLTDAGKPVRILGGARLVGRLGGWDVGMFDMQTARSDMIAAENFGVVRLRRRVLNPYSYTGGMVAMRIDEDGRSNVAVGVDGVLRLLGDEYLTVKWAEVHASGDTTGSSRWDRGQLFVRWRRRTERGLTYFAQLNRAGPAYDPGVGFANRHDFTRLSLYAQYGWFQPESSRLRRWMPGVIANLQWRNEDRSLHSTYLAHWWQFETKHGAGGWFEPRLLHEDVRSPFSFGGETQIPEGSYWFPDVWLYYNTPLGGLFRAAFDAQVGGFYDGWRVQLKVTPTWNVSHAVELSGSYQLAALRFPNRGQSLATHLARLRVGTAASAKLSANTFLQFNSLSGRVTVNARVRYNFREGNDLWIVYNEGINTDRDPLNPTLPHLPFTDTRAVMVKFTYTLIT